MRKPDEKLKQTGNMIRMFMRHDVDPQPPGHKRVYVAWGTPGVIEQADHRIGGQDASIIMVRRDWWEKVYEPGLAVVGRQLILHADEKAPGNIGPDGAERLWQVLALNYRPEVLARPIGGEATTKLIADVRACWVVEYGGLKRMSDDRFAAMEQCLRVWEQAISGEEPAEKFVPDQTAIRKLYRASQGQFLAATTTPKVSGEW
jgi:hypothetical protein